MIEHRPFAQLGRFDNEWLAARYHFSFSDYHDPARMGWGRLRVWNDDTIQPQTGFAPHGHRDMEIITFVRTGAITHEDSMGHRGRTGAGDVQVMSACAGVRHAEFNMEDEATTLFQIWIEPDESGGPPAWGSARFPRAERDGAFRILASGRADDQAKGALAIRADARVMAVTLEPLQAARLEIDPARHVYLAAASGGATVNGVALAARDGAAIRHESRVEAVAGPEGAELVLVDCV